MKISVLLASPDALDYNLIDVMRVLNTTFDELGEKLNFIKLDQKNIPPLINQYPVNDVANIINQLSNSDGVIFACTSNLFAPCSILQNFLDYLSLPIYNNFLKEKNCFTIVVSNETGEQESAAYINRVIQHFGGFSPVVTAINKNIASQFNTNKDFTEIFEKQVEDYYRVLRQNRKFFTSYVDAETNSLGSSFDNFGYPVSMGQNQMQGYQYPQHSQHLQQTPQMQQPQQPQYSPHSHQPFMQGQTPNDFYAPNGEYAHLRGDFDEYYTGVPNYDASQQIQAKIGVSQASSLTNPTYIPEPLQPQQNNYTNFGSIDNVQDNSFLDNLNTPSRNDRSEYSQTEYGSDIIEDLGEDFMQNKMAQAQAYNQPELKNDFITTPTPSPQNTNQNPQSSGPLSIKQQTLTLDKKFLPQNANGLVTEIQIKITGEETFDATIQINGTECRLHDGSSSSADVTIIGTSDVWQDVLNGLVTTQKAFMTGQLKVRGNFVLLPRFDTLFKFN